MQHLFWSKVFWGIWFEHFVFPTFFVLAIFLKQRFPLVRDQNKWPVGSRRKKRSSWTLCVLISMKMWRGSCWCVYIKMGRVYLYTSWRVNPVTMSTVVVLPMFSCFLTFLPVAAEPSALSVVCCIFASAGDYHASYDAVDEYCFYSHSFLCSHGSGLCTCLTVGVNTHVCFFPTH